MTSKEVSGKAIYRACGNSADLHIVCQRRKDFSTFRQLRMHGTKPHLHFTSDNGRQVHLTALEDVRVEPVTTDEKPKYTTHPAPPKTVQA